MQKLPISVILIVKNEEHNLTRCLDSVAGFASEIIAVLNDCSDNSAAILAKYNALAYQHQWHGFVKQKNLALSYASYPWVFSIDADEQVTPAMYREIEQVVSSSNSHIVAVSFRRKTWLLGRWIKHGDWYPDRVLRLFRRDLAKFTGNYVHEKLVVSGEIFHSKTNLLHYSFPTMYLFLTKNEKFTRDFISANLEHKRFSYSGTILRSFWKFIRGYIFKLGFLDGYAGLIIAIQQSYSTFFRYNMLLEHKLSKKSYFLDAEDE